MGKTGNSLKGWRACAHIPGIGTNTEHGENRKPRQIQMNGLKHTSPLKISIILLLCVGAFFPMPANSEDTEVVDRIVAVVNEDIITLSELNRVSAPYIKRIRAAGYSAEKEKKETYNIQDKALDKLIDQKLEEQEIKQAGITVGDPEIDGAIENIKKNNIRIL